VAAFIFTLLESTVLGKVPSKFELSPLNHDTMIWTIAVVVIVVISLVYVFSELPYCLKFLIGRTQYYIVLSHIVFEHMGLFVGDANREYVEELKLRASLTPGGIDRAIKNILEGRLFVSRCVQQKLESHLTEANLSEFDVSFRTAPRKNHYPNKVLRIFNQCDLIFLSYRGNVNANERRGRLLMLQFDPEPCPRCGNPAEWCVRSKRYFCATDQFSFP